MSKEKFVQTINEQIDILYQRSGIKKMVSIFIDKYPKDVFVNYRETESFENHLLDCLCFSKTANQENYFDEYKRIGTLCISLERRKITGNYYSGAFVEAFNQLLTLFIKEKFIKDELIGSFIVWGLLRKMAIECISNKFLLFYGDSLMRLETLAVEGCYKWYYENQSRGLIEYEYYLFLYFLMDKNKISQNIITEAEKLSEFLTKYEKENESVKFENELECLGCRLFSIHLS